MSEQLFNKAVLLHQKGNLEDAERLYLQLLGDGGPADFEVRYMLAFLRHQQGRNAEALQAVEAALAGNPTAAKALMLHGVLLLLAEKPQEALAQFTAAAACDPGNMEPWYTRGVVLAGLNRPQEAVTSFDEALAIQPTADCWNNRGAALQSLKRWQEALKSFDAALELKPVLIEALVGKSNVLEQMGCFSEALEASGQALQLQPANAAALNTRAISFLALQRFEEALAACDRLLELHPGLVATLSNRALALLNLKRFEEALESCELALQYEPGHGGAWCNRGVALMGLHRHEQAIACFDTAMAASPHQVEALLSRGTALQNLKSYESAIDSYDKALDLAPDYIAARVQRAKALQKLYRLDEALAGAEEALKISPNDPDALNTRGRVLCDLNRVPEAIPVFRRRAEQIHAGQAWTAADDPAQKQRHDAEQRDYLSCQGVTAETGIYFAAGERLAGPAVNPLNGAAIETEWKTRQPAIVVIDNLLTQDALDGLRRFCWGSTFWRRSYKNGYLGAMLEDGFACPLLAQIADELRSTFPGIFAEHALRQMWGFKYDSSLQGIELHADQAAVNVNFWITPDEANINPEGGGLTIWDVCAPLEWDFAQYNANSKAVRTFLTGAGAKPVTVPYRANRAVIFDSNLFHETDKIEFKDGYLNRRINVTMLYGRRTSDGS